MRSLATQTGRCRIPVGAVLALLAWGALPALAGRSALSVAGAAAAPADLTPAGQRSAAAPIGDAAPVATVLGKAIHTQDPETLRNAILTPLLDQYAARRGLRASPLEVNATLNKMRRDLAPGTPAPADDLTPAERLEMAAMQRAVARDLIRQWKINKALYDQYGGRVIYQQFGPEPLDAYRAFLRERAADGAFAIHDQALAASFWRYFNDDSFHDFMTPGGRDEARAFTTQPWKR